MCHPLSLDLPNQPLKGKEYKESLGRAKQEGSFFPVEQLRPGFLAGEQMSFFETV